MKYFRLVLVHLILLCFIMFLSFGSLYMLKTNPDAQKLMHYLKKDWNFAEMVKQSFIIFGISIFTIYSFYFAIFNLLLRKKSTLKNSLLSMAIIVLLVGLNMIFSNNKISLSQVPNSLVLILIFGGIGLGARSIIEYIKTKEQQKELERKNLKIELNMLRSQINPHFLFNTLNNIDALIRKDPERASELLIKLSQEMRYMLYDSNTEKINLVSEVEFIKDYISLQKLRLKNPNVIELTLAGNFENIMLPPMLFIPFIENAFKYCNKFDVEKSIVIKLSVSNNELTFESSNYYDPDIKPNNLKTSGIGLEVVEKRLDLLYPDKHIFNISKIDCQFNISLKIQLDGN